MSKNYKYLKALTWQARNNPSIWVEDPENINACLNDQFQSAQLMITSENGMTFDNLADKKTKAQRS